MGLLGLGLNLGYAKLFQPVCFVAGTMVLVGFDADGNAISKPIEEVAEGDVVLARADGDEADGLDARAVARVFRRTSDHLRHVRYVDAAGNAEHVQTTDEHPFWVEGRGWTAAGDLRPGDVLGDADGLGGARLTVLSSVREEHPEGVAVYNFEVEGDHTYLVEDGAAGGGQAWAWVHNRCVNAKKIAADAHGAAPAGMSRPHGHHVVQQGKFKNELARRRVLVESRLILRKHGINYKRDPRNIYWAPNGPGHTFDYNQRVLAELRAVDDIGGTADDIAEVLRRIAGNFPNF